MTIETNKGLSQLRNSSSYVELAPNESLLLGYFQSRAVDKVHVLDLGLGKLAHEESHKLLK